MIKGLPELPASPLYLSKLLNGRHRRLLLLMSVFAQALFTLVRCHLVTLVLFTVWHIIKILD